MRIIDFNVKIRQQEFIPDVIPTPNKAMQSYGILYNCFDRFSPETVEATIDRARKFGIEKAVVRGTCAEDTELIVKLLKDYPDFFIPFGGIDINKGATPGYQALQSAFEDHDFLGLSVGPMFTGIYINDPRYYPLYALCDDRKKILIAHTALHYNPVFSYDLGDPKYLDRVAVDFPDLKIVIGHAGQGFATQGLSVAHRHRNVYLDFSALAPEVVIPEVIFAANTFLRKKCLFGTCYPLIDFDVVDRWKKVISESNHELFFHDNAAKLMGL